MASNGIHHRAAHSGPTQRYCLIVKNDTANVVDDEMEFVIS